MLFLFFSQNLKLLLFFFIETNQGFNLKARTIHQKTRESDLKKPFVPIEVLSPEQIESG